MTLKRILMLIPVAIVGGFLLIQLVPYGRGHDNPPVTSEPNWDSPETRALAKTACFDCHSNETDWSPWYASVAPSSWLVQHDVEEGRQHLNFSEWNDGGKPRELDELWEVLAEGEMPPAVYILQHPEADLTPAQVEQLVSGLKATVRN